MEILVFLIEGQKYALDINHVERGLLAAQYTHMPNCSELILGAINMHGEIVPVVNMRKMFNLIPKEITPSDNLILCKVQDQRIALLVDRVERVRSCNEPLLDRSTQCILKEQEGITLFCNLEKIIQENDLLVKI